MFKKVIKLLLRYLTQIFFIFLFVFFYYKTKFPISEKLPLNFFFRIDPLIGISTTLSTLHFNYLLWPSLLTVLFLLVLGNFFCWWVCPFGGIIDLFNLIFFRKKWKISRKIPNYLRKLRVFIFWGLILNSLIFIFSLVPNFFWFSYPYVILTRALLFRNWFIIFIIIIVINIFFPRFWCYNICPLGYFNYLIGIKLRNKIKKKIAK
jgi:polyferredoxin